MARSQTISLANIHFPPCPPSSPLRVYSVWQTLHSRPLRRKRRSTIHQSSLILTHLDHSSSIPPPRTQISLTRTRKASLTSPSHPKQAIAKEFVQLTAFSSSTLLPTLDNPTPLSVPGLLREADLEGLTQDLPELLSVKELDKRLSADQSKGLTEQLPELKGLLTEQEATSAILPKRPPQLRLLE